MPCLKPVWLSATRYNKGMYVPCGKCFACLKDRAFQNSLRCYFEASAHSSNVFLTLTFDDDHLPKSVSKVELQNYIKRVRRHIDFKIRYFACGEYGGKSGRPHYHLILFGFPFAKFGSNCSKCRSSEGKSCGVLCGCWNKGHVQLGTVTEASCRYVANYLQKKSFGTKDERSFEGLTPPFVLQSRSLGYSVFHSLLSLYVKNGFTLHGRHMSLPRTWMQKIRRDAEKTGELSDDEVRLILNVRKFARENPRPAVDIYEYFDKFRDYLSKRELFVPDKSWRDSFHDFEGLYNDFVSNFVVDPREYHDKLH